MNCPACRIPLVVVEREGIEIDWCVECRGLWFDAGELELLGERAGVALAAPIASGPAEEAGGERPARRCPRCARRMALLGLAGDDGRTAATVDRCHEHGWWLDLGELGRILGARSTEREADDALMIRFLGETFRAGAATGRPPGSGRRSWS